MEWLTAYWWIGLVTVPLVAWVIHRVAAAREEADRVVRPAARPAFPIELRNRQAKLPVSRGVAVAGVAFGALLLVVVIALAFARGEYGDVVTAVAALVGLPFLAIQLRERVILTGESIVFRSGLPEALRWLQPGWEIALDQIEDVRFESSAFPAAPLLRAILIDIGESKPRRLRPFQWVDPESDDEAPLASLQAWSKRGPIEAAFHETPVMAYLREAGFDLRQEETEEARAFDLGANPATRVLLGLAVALGLYAAVDGIALEETYASATGFSLFLIAGTGAAGVAGLWLARSRVPIAEALGVSGVLGLAFSLALYPGSLRVNQISDREGLKTYEYEMVTADQLHALAPDAPPLEFWYLDEYLSDYEVGSLHTFQLRQGALGFPQLYEPPILQRMNTTN